VLPPLLYQLSSAIEELAAYCLICSNFDGLASLPHLVTPPTTESAYGSETNG
jgi:hypothetical protein